MFDMIYAERAIQKGQSYESNFKKLLKYSTVSIE